jgi:hypothetical protein
MGMLARRLGCDIKIDGDVLLNTCRPTDRAPGNTHRGLGFASRPVQLAALFM